MPPSALSTPKSHLNNNNNNKNGNHRMESDTSTTATMTTTPSSLASSLSSLTNAANDNTTTPMPMPTTIHERKTHIEVCVRIRPLMIDRSISSTSFFDEKISTPAAAVPITPARSGGGGNSSSTPSSRTPAAGAAAAATPAGSRRSIPSSSSTSRKPQIPRLSHLTTPKTSGKGGTSGKNGNASSAPGASPATNKAGGQQESDMADFELDNGAETVCAWDVVPPDTVLQSSATDIIPGRTHIYTLDHVYGPNTTTNDLYQNSVQPLVHAAMDGYHTSVLAYGQTSTGKTHTMTGTVVQPGLIPLAVQECFDYITKNNNTSSQEREYLLRVSYLEVYKEHIRDLLVPTTSQPPAPVRLFESAETGLVIRGLREEVVTTPDDVFALLAEGEARRQVGATHMNQHSSRSHVMVRLWIESRSVHAGAGGNNKRGSPMKQQQQRSGGGGNNNSIRISSLSLVDLAGSESVRLTGSADRRQEGHYINKSLMTLGQVVYALSEFGSPEAAAASKKHVPYRDSKLTRLLQPSLSGNAQVVLICCISPLPKHVEESHNTFKFAIRAKKIPQKATIHEADATDEKTLLQSYREEIEDLKQQLADAKKQQERLLQQTKTSITASEAAYNYYGRQESISEESLVSEDEIRELAEAIQTMEKLILKSNVTAATPAGFATATSSTSTTPKAITPNPISQPEDWLLDNSTTEYFDADMILPGSGDAVYEEDLLALVASSSSTRSKSAKAASGGGETDTVTKQLSSLSIATTDAPTPAAAGSSNSGHNTPRNDAQITQDLHAEFSRLQGLLGAVLNRKRRNAGHNNNNTSISSLHYNHHQSGSATSPTFAGASEEEVKALRAQLEQQEVTTSLRKADASFLQQQLEEKDDLLREVSKVFEQVEERQTQLEAENAALRNELTALKSRFATLERENAMLALTASAHDMNLQQQHNNYPHTSTTTPTNVVVGTIKNQ